MQPSTLILFILVAQSQNTVVNELKLKIEVLNDNVWLSSASFSISTTQHLKVRCTIEGQNDFPLTWSKKNSDDGSFVMLRNGSSQMVSHEIKDVQLMDSGTYSCNASAFSTIFELYVYNLTLQNASVPTRLEYDHIGKLQLIRRNLDRDAYNVSAGIKLCCTLITGRAHSVEMVTVHWEGGLFGLLTNQSELQSVYTRVIRRNLSASEISTHLSLVSPILDSRAYGEYRCIFGFPSSNVIGRVYLHVPPILRLTYDPPPLPPANFSSHFTCADPPCKGSADESSLSDSGVVNWTSACEVLVAFPPLLKDGLKWAWTNAQWASYAVERVKSVGKSTYLSELRAMESDKLDLVSPWQVLERRRRHVQTTPQYGTMDTQPTGPVVFLCWAENALGRTTVWWPGPAEDPGSNFWASIWWPVLGVALEVASLVMVFGLFQCCSRGGRLRSYFTGQQVEHTSFGLSRLFDAENSSELVRTGRQAEAIKRAAQCRPPGNVHYVRLSNSVPSELHEDDYSTQNTASVHENEMHCHVNPLLEDGSQEVDNVKPDPRDHDGDEYFWDSDTESNAPVSQK